MDDRERIDLYLSRHPELELTGAAITRLAGDASSRRYYRAAAASRSAIVTVYPEPFDPDEGAVPRLDRLLEVNPDAMLSYANDPLAQLEMTAFLRDEGLPVPVLLGVDGAEGFILFEDLGDDRLIETLDGASPERRQALYEEAIDLVVRLQATTPALRRAGVIGSRLEFSTAKLMWEMEFFLTHFFDGYRGRALTPAEQGAARSELEPLCAWLAARPQVLCHRDYHARNLMMRHGALYLIDYQDARLGPASYDLVSLLIDPYVPPEYIDVDALRSGYAVRTGHDRDPDFEAEWRAMTIQRLLKAAGTYAFQTARRGARQFEPYLMPTLTRADQDMRRHGGLERLRHLIFER